MNINNENITQRKKSVFSHRDYFKPFDYPIFFKAWSDQQSMFWLPSEICLTTDAHQFQHELTDDERSIYMNIFRIFSHADFCVSQGYMLLLQKFKVYEIQATIAAFINMETIHAEAYSNIPEKLNIDVSIHQEFRKYQLLVEKNDLMSKWRKVEDNDHLELLRTIARMSVFTEGFVLFGLFGILLNLPRFSILKGVGQITTFSMRDETLHHQTMVELFKITRDELLRDKLITADDVKKLITDLNIELETALDLEMQTIDFIFNNDKLKLRGTCSGEIKQYIIALASNRVTKIGLTMPGKFEIDINLYPKWLDEVVKLREHVDFFVQRPTEYRKAKIDNLSDSDFM